MGSEESWSVFERTGSIEDYLNYTACTKEEQIQNRYYGNGDDIGYGNSTRDTSWNDFVSDACGGK